MIHIIVHPIRDRQTAFLKAAKRLGVHCKLIEFFNFSFIYQENETEVLFKSNHYTFPKLIYFYGGRNILQLRIQLATLALQNQTQIIDRCINKNPYWQSSKFMEGNILSKAKIPIIPTVVFSDFDSFIDSGWKHFPLITKLSNLSQGEGVFLCRNENEVGSVFYKFPNQTQLVQPFIENNGDYRVFVIGDKCLGAIKRVRKNLKSDYLNNVSHGATAIQVELTDEMQQLALASTKCLDLNIAGVDLIEIKGKLSVIEVNQSPQFEGFMQATGVDVPEKIVEYLASQSQ